MAIISTVDLSQHPEHGVDIRELSRLSKEEWREFTKTVWQIANVSHGTHPAVFPVEIPNRLIKLFSLYGETVLDPFSGIGTTVKSALQLNRRAIGIEQSEDFYEIMIREMISEFGKDNIDTVARIIRGDSRNMSFVDNDSVGLVVTSPPYWNKADYGQNEANLGNFERYPEFIESLRPVFKECFRVLKPGRKMGVVTANVNQFTDRGLLTFPIAADLIVLLRELGFVLITEIVWSKDGTGGKWGSFGEQRPIFGSYPYPPNFLFKNVHEYVIVVAKPPDKKNANPKALPYQWLMGEDAG